MFDLNSKLNDTQFADYHVHGWNFRGSFTRDREGYLLDSKGAIITAQCPAKWPQDLYPKTDKPGADPLGQDPKLNDGKAVHMMDIHAEKGMQCADCHYSQDSHGGLTRRGRQCGETAATATARPPPTRPCAHRGSRRTKGNDLCCATPTASAGSSGWSEAAAGCWQRSLLDPNLEWRIHLTKDTVDPTSPDFNAKSARAKLMKISQNGKPMAWARRAKGDRAHRDNMECFACHTSWTTACRLPPADRGELER